MLKIIATPSLVRAAKKFHRTEKLKLDEVVKEVATDPTLGEEKKGDLVGVFVCKLTSNKQQVLLSCSLQPSKFLPEIITLLSFGSHENFYSAN